MSEDIRISVPEVATPEASIVLPPDVVGVFQVIVHPISHDVIAIS